MKKAPLDVDWEIESPENVRLTYQAAGPAQRCLAFALDSLIRAIILVSFICLALWTSKYLPGVTWGVLLLVLFSLEWGYHVICEGLFRGKTIGKDALGLRVVQSEGCPLTFFAALQRNLLRIVDGVPLLAVLAITLKPQLFSTPMAWNISDFWPVLLTLPVYGPALISMMATKHFQRLGDLAAGTIVICERRSSLIREPIILSKIEPLPPDEINANIPHDETLTLIDEFLSRRDELTYSRGHQLCQEFAFALADFLDYQGEQYQLNDYPMSFLARVHVTFARADEEDAAEAPWNGPMDGNSATIAVDHDGAWL